MRAVVPQRPSAHDKGHELDRPERQRPAEFLPRVRPHHGAAAHVVAGVVLVADEIAPFVRPIAHDARAALAVQCKRPDGLADQAQGNFRQRFGLRQPVENAGLGQDGQRPIVALFLEP